MLPEGPRVVRSAPFGPAGVGTTGDRPSDVRLEPLVVAAMLLMLWAVR